MDPEKRNEQVDTGAIWTQQVKSEEIREAVFLVC